MCTYSHTDTHTPITIKCFRTLEIKKRLAAIQGAFIYETRFRLSVKAKLRGSLMCPILILPLPVSWEALKTRSWQSGWKAAAWQPFGADEGWSSLKAPFTEHCFLWPMWWSSGRPYLPGLSVFIPTWSSLSAKSLFSGVICQKQSETINFNPATTWASLVAQLVKNLPVMQKSPVWFLSGRPPVEGIGCPLQYLGASLMAQKVKNSPAMWETWVWSLGWQDPFEKEKATHSSRIHLENPHGQCSLEGYSPWDCKESDTAQQLSTAQGRRQELRQTIGGSERLTTKSSGTEGFSWWSSG